ncbi:predicted protein [Nematostella vectensis]|uniref:Uncharacterized protein n=1 Tax=Nematostella vectensis TaxID=45351 RepID=A7SRE2_NEMVE|nr:predicted protein [Nematostella vectensis]|eukprot:XP_001625839.1 predicted protein [Nematostella vectensis]
MKMASPRQLQILAIISVFSLSCAQVVMLGNCNKTFFNEEAAKCQRIALEKMVTLKRTCADVEMAMKEKCVEPHVSHCLKGTPYAVFMSSASQFLEKVMFTCNPSDSFISNGMLIQALQCNSSVMEVEDMLKRRIPDCWRPMARKLSGQNGNPQDPALCQMYQDAKRCVSNETARYCHNINVESDPCNIFCASKADHGKVCQELPKRMLCSNITELYSKVKQCHTTFIDLVSGNLSNTCSNTLPKYHNCIGGHIIGCFDPYPDPSQFTMIRDLVTSATWTTRLFCSAAPLNLATFPNDMKRFVPGCTQKFFVEAEKCGAGMRGTFKEKRSDKEFMCREFSGAKECFRGAARDYCGYSKDALDAITGDHFNPYCKDLKDISAAPKSQLVASAILLSICLQIARLVAL